MPEIPSSLFLSLSPRFAISSDRRTVPVNATIITDSLSMQYTTHYPKRMILLQSFTLHWLQPGASIPLRQWCIPPCFRLPPISEKFLRLNRKFYLFSDKIFQFSFAKISEDRFLVIDYKFLNFPPFSLFKSIFPIFRTNFQFPTFPNFPLFS